MDASPRVQAQRQAVDALQDAPALVAQRRRAEALGHAPRSPVSAARPGAGVVQGAFIVNGNRITGKALKNWLSNVVGSNHKHIAAVIRGWDRDNSYTTDHADDVVAYGEAKKIAEDTNDILEGNALVAGLIRKDVPNSIAWGDVNIWAGWYFNGLEYQDNKTGGWHSNRNGWLPGDPTEDGHPTRYVEFRRPGAVGKKEEDKLERCIFDLLTGRCWPNAHYDGGYVEITDIPGGFQSHLMQIAYVATGLKDRADKMTEEEKLQAGAGFQKIQWLLTALANELEK